MTNGRVSSVVVDQHSRNSLRKQLDNINYEIHTIEGRIKFLRDVVGEVFAAVCPGTYSVFRS
jgi:hypothetical protein